MEQRVEQGFSKQGKEGGSGTGTDTRPPVGT